MLRVFGCMVASRGGYRMARGWHYAKLSLSNAPPLSFSGLCILLFIFPSLCRFLCVCVFLLLSLELGRCSSDLFLSSRPRTGLATTYITGYQGMVEARSVNVKKKTGGCSEGLGAFRFFFKQQQQREDDVENHPKSSGNAEVINTKARALGVFLRFQGNTRELQSRD